MGQEGYKPIRVLQMIGSLNVGGSQTFILNLYRFIDKRYIQFDFIIDHPKQTYFLDDVKKLGARVYIMPSFNGRNILQVKKEWNMFFQNHPEYQILHSHVRSYASIYIPIAKKYGLKTIIHSHSTSNGVGATAIIKRILQYSLRYQADAFMGCSCMAGEWLFGKKIVESNKYMTIKNFIDVDGYKCDWKIRHIYRQKLKLNDRKVCIHVGRFHESKNHEFLLRVFKKLHDEDNRFLLILVGDGELRTEIEKQIDLLKIKKDVILLGERKDIPELLACADCFLFPSKWEGFPMTVAEAQASGLPCFVSVKVPKDVSVSKLVKYLEIDETAISKWVDAVLESTLERKTVTSDLIVAGLDVRDAASKMKKFYLDFVR